MTRKRARVLALVWNQSMHMPEKLFYKSITRLFNYSLLLILTLPVIAYSQQKDKKNQTPPPAPLALKRTTVRHETRRLGYGSAVTILGAPSGSIIIEGWNKSEVDITAEIELQADTEEDLARLAEVNTFTLD